jgi:hypothetical protein
MIPTYGARKKSPRRRDDVFALDGLRRTKPTRGIDSRQGLAESEGVHLEIGEDAQSKAVIHHPPAYAFGAQYLSSRDIAKRCRSAKRRHWRVTFCEVCITT